MDYAGQVLAHPLLLFAVLLRQTEQRGRLPNLIFLLLLLAMAALIALTWNSSHPSIQHLVALVSVLGGIALSFRRGGDEQHDSGAAERGDCLKTEGERSPAFKAEGDVEIKYEK